MISRPRNNKGYIRKQLFKELLDNFYCNFHYEWQQPQPTATKVIKDW